MAWYHVYPVNYFDAAIQDAASKFSSAYDTACSIPAAGKIQFYTLYDSMMVWQHLRLRRCINNVLLQNGFLPGHNINATVASSFVGACVAQYPVVSRTAKSWFLRSPAQSLLNGLQSCRLS